MLENLISALYHALALCNGLEYSLREVTMNSVIILLNKIIVFVLMIAALNAKIRSSLGTNNCALLLCGGETIIGEGIISRRCILCGHLRWD